jgi:glucokinase
VNPEHGHVAGLDIEATRMRLVVVDFAGAPVWETQATLNPDLDRTALLEAIVGFAADSVAAARARHPRLLGLGLGVPGMADTRSGTILRYDMIPSATDLPLRDLVAARVNLPCVMDHNMRALTVAEWMQGAAQHLDTFVCLAVRSGIGAGMVVDGRLYNGSHGFAGEVGYMGMSGRPGPQRRLRDHVSERTLGLESGAGESALSPARARAVGAILGSQIASIAAVIDPQAIVLAGGLFAQPHGELWDQMAATFREVTFSELAERIQLLPARLGAFGAAIGAAHLCLHHLHPLEPITS